MNIIDLRQLILVFAISSTLSVCLCLLTIKLAQKYRLWSGVDFRRKNTQKVALLGGGAIFLASLVTSVLFGIFDFKIIFLSALPLIFAGVLDDIYELSARKKFFGQILAVSLFLYLTPTNQMLFNSLGWPIPFTYAVSGFWMIGIINAMNMFDGMDGEAASFSIIALIGIAFLPWHNSDLALLSVLVGSVTGFLVLNFQPAKIYLGDSGSTFLGFLLSALCITGHFGEISQSAIFAPLFIMALPEIDAVLAMWRRLTKGSSPFVGDHDHIHHKLLKLGLTVRQTFLLLCFVSIATAMTAVFAIQVQPDGLKYSVIFLNAGLLTCYLGFVYFMEYRQAYLMSFYGRTLIEQNLRYIGPRPVDTKNFRATVYDLLPYYKELQKDGILAVQAFTQDFARFIEVIHGSNPGIIMLSNYALLCTESPRSSLLISEEKISQEFYKILAVHKVQKNTSGHPWGLSFYSDQYKSHEFINRFRSSNYTGIEVESKKSA